MPELPEVETTRRGISPHVLGRKVQKVVVRESRLRWPVPEQLEQALSGARITAVNRRAKYLLVETDSGILMVHLGMSGSLRIMPAGTPPLFHDHIDVVLDDGNESGIKLEENNISRHYFNFDDSKVIKEGR